MDTKTPWWHKFMTKECILIAFAGFVFGAWTVWYHMRDGLPELEPVPDPEVECHDTVVPVRDSVPTMCPSAQHRMGSPWAGMVVCSCQTKPHRK